MNSGNIVKYNNIIRKTQFARRQVFAAFDLKCIDTVLGLSGHAGKRACLWFKALRNEEFGKLKILGSRDYCLKNILWKIAPKNLICNFI